MPTIQLPDGHSAELRDDDVRRSDVKYAGQIADKELRLTGNQQGNMQAQGVTLMTAVMQDAIITRFTRSWTLTDEGGRPLPVTLEVVQDLPLKYYKPLAAATLPMLKEILNIGEAISNGQPDPLSAGPSSMSAPTD